jgi:excisionase family DNA binding protein
MRPLRAAKRIIPAAVSAAVTVSEETGGSVLDDGFMSVPECADFLRVSRSSIYLMMEQGKLAFAKFGKSRRVPRRSLMQLAQECMTREEHES